MANSVESSNHVTVPVFINKRKIEQLAKNFNPNVVVLEPEEVRQRIRENLERSLIIYKKDKD